MVSVSDETAEIVAGELAVGKVDAGTSVELALPPLGVAAAKAQGEAVVLVRALLRDDTTWAGVGHVVGTGQLPLPAGEFGEPIVAPATPVSVPPARVDTRGRHIHLGEAMFDEIDGRLLTLGGLRIASPQLNLWRAPTDNDMRDGDLLARWRAFGLDRLRHRTVSVSTADDGRELVVVTRVSPAQAATSMLVTFRWRAPESGGGRSPELSLHIDVVPDDTWTITLPRMGIRLGLPSWVDDAAWFGLGPGEAYVDSRSAVVLGRWSGPLETLQTPYVFPQENGNRLDTRWVELGDHAGHGLRIAGEQPFGFSARRWTDDQLDRATHTVDLAATGQVWVDLDIAQRGIGTAACGPTLRERYALEAAPASMSLRLSLMEALL